MIALVLFPPINYRVDADTDSVKKTLAVSVYVTFLFKIIRVNYDKDGEKSDTRVKVLWFLVSGGKKNDSSEKNAKKIEEKKKRDGGKTRKNETGTSKGTGEKVEVPSGESAPEPKDKRGIAKKIGGTYDSIKKIVNHDSKKEIIKYTLQGVSELLRAIKPKKFILRGTVGFEDPSVTGYLIALISVIRGLTRLNINVAGCFDDKMHIIYCKANGSTSIWALLYPCVRWLLRKPIWTIFKPMIFKKKTGKEEEYGNK